ncbi:heavy metal translocating P-type ATPase [Crocosphaera sp.]|uniref:heavy metal translocating P-type ATPase n=1 Tax=Crocosphaera sp. TaxID=2729996 RepID=UPI002620FFE9|nr:heavy metal translocating P-type ATPase [Crocosphaera sp.]MDJ0580171.1 heavy metal translocating P-type ATPase [Crocosphaera sp.]
MKTIPQIVHHIPGRVRFRIHRLSYDRRFALRLKQLLKAANGIEKVRLNDWAASVVIDYNFKKEYKIEEYIVDIIEKAETNYNLIIKKEKKKNLEEWSTLTLPSLATILAFGASKLPIPGLKLVASLILLKAAFPVVKRAYESLSNKQTINIDCLDSLALIFSGLQGQMVTPALVITLHELGDIIREKTARSTEIKTNNLLDTIGHFAWVERDNKIIHVESNGVEIGDIVVVYPGERIPVDGKVIKGKAIIDQQQLTGESMPVVAEIETDVYASTLLRSGEIRIKCDKVGEKTRAAASIQLLEKAPVHDTRMANYAANLAEQLMMPSLCLAGLILIVTQDPQRVASILTLDFVTGIRVSIPTAFLGALNHTTRHGILVRSGRTLELLSEIDTIVFDKTGTLTEGNIQVMGVETVTETVNANTLLQLAASTEQRITHPIAEAIAKYAQQENINILPRDHWDYEVGLGMVATIAGKTVLVGSQKLLISKGVAIQETPQMQEKSALSPIYVACDGEFQGIIYYTDPLRPESTKLIQRLQKDYDIEVNLLTGDNQTRATEVAERLQIPLSNVHAEAFPEDKAKIVRDLHNGCKTVAFVGDGLNDSVALAYADVSISFENGSEIARDTADVVLMNNNLMDLLEAIAIAKATKALINQNTLMVVAPNLAALGLATSVGLNPLLATLIHNGTAIAAGLNSLRPLVQHQLESS